jgi:hypothetical protein
VLKLLPSIKGFLKQLKIGRVANFFARVVDGFAA